MSRSPLPLLRTLTGPTLPASVVDLMIQRICRRATARAAGRRGTAGARKARTQGTGNLSPFKSSAVSISPSPVGSPDGFSPHSPITKRTLFSVSRENSPLLALCDLEFRKAFLILNYTGRRKREEHMKVDDIMMLKDLPMRDFETKVWDAVGKDFINKKDRIQVEQLHPEQGSLPTVLSLSLSGLTNPVMLPLLRFRIHFWGVWYFCFTAISKGAEFQVFSSQNRLGTSPDGLRIYLAFCIQDNDSVGDETNHDNNSEMNCVKSFKAFCLLNACR